MSKRELVLGALDRQEVERVPVGFWFHFAPGALFNDDPAVIEKNINGHQAFFDAFRPDFLKLMSDGYFKYPNPAIEQVRTAADLKGIKAVGAKEWIRAQAELVKELTGRFGKEVATFYNIFSPATYLKMQLVQQGVSLGALADEDPEAVRDALLEIAKDVAELARAVIDQGGADGIYFSAQNLQDASLTKEEYLKYIAPAEIFVLNAANKSGDYNILHICGFKGAKNDLTTYVDYPAKAVNWAVTVEGVSLEEGKELFGGRTVIGGFGNTEHDLLYKGTREQIQAETRAILEKAGTRGVILGADCTVPSDISYEHLEWVRQAAKEFSAK